MARRLLVRTVELPVEAGVLLEDIGMLLAKANVMLVEGGTILVELSRSEEEDIANDDDAIDEVTEVETGGFESMYPLATKESRLRSNGWVYSALLPLAPPRTHRPLTKIATTQS